MSPAIKRQATGFFPVCSARRMVLLQRETLQIGDPEIDTESRAGYDVDLTSVNINATIRSLNHSTYEFDPVNDKFYYDYSGTPKGATLGSRSAEKCSEPIFPTEARLPR